MQGRLTQSVARCWVGMHLCMYTCIHLRGRTRDPARWDAVAQTRTYARVRTSAVGEPDATSRPRVHAQRDHLHVATVRLRMRLTK